MPVITIPKREWDHHPPGQHEGFFYDVEEIREFDTQFGMKEKIPFKIESTTAFREDEQPYIISMWATNSSAPNANLRKWRERVLDRELTKEELETFDTHAEFVPIRIGYIVAHKPKADGSGDISSYVETFWRLKEQGDKPVSKQHRYDGENLSEGVSEKTLADIDKTKDTLDKLFGPTEEVKEEEIEEQSTDLNTEELIKQAERIEEILGIEKAHISKSRKMFMDDLTDFKQATVEQIKEYIKQIKGLAPADTDFSFENDDIPF